LLHRFATLGSIGVRARHAHELPHCGSGRKEMSATITSADDIVYPGSDAKPMADGQQRARVIRRLVAGFERVLSDRQDVLVGGDFFWYPVEGNPKIVVAPDVTILFGVDKDDDLPNYRSWVYGGSIALAVELMSSSNTWREMTEKRMFYDRYGMPECWVFDPETAVLEVWRRTEDGGLFAVADPARGYVSPLGDVRVSVEDGDLVVREPDGRIWPRLAGVGLHEASEARAAAETARVVAENRAADLQRQLDDRERDT